MSLFKARLVASTMLAAGAIAALPARAQTPESSGVVEEVVVTSQKRA